MIPAAIKSGSGRFADSLNPPGFCFSTRKNIQAGFVALHEIVVRKYATTLGLFAFVQHGARISKASAHMLATTVS